MELLILCIILTYDLHISKPRRWLVLVPQVHPEPQPRHPHIHPQRAAPAAKDPDRDPKFPKPHVRIPESVVHRRHPPQQPAPAAGNTNPRRHQQCEGAREGHADAGQ